MPYVDSPSPQHNHLLRDFPADARSRIFSHLQVLDLPSGKILHEAGDTQRYVYFPTNCIVSLLNMLENGSATEISVVGNDGVVGVASFMGGASSLHHGVVQSAGWAYRLSAQRLSDECDINAELLQLLLRYTQCLVTQVAQTTVCYRHHTILQQLCRWFLLSLDRLPVKQLNITQEMIANLLGVRREGITEAAGKLQKLGIIHYHRGHISILDRPRLEQLSCECYAVVKKETDRLTSFPLPIQIAAMNKSTVARSS